MVQQSLAQTVSPRLTRVLIVAARYAGEQLSVFLERDVRLRGTEARRVRLEELPRVLNGEERLITGIYLAFNGDIEGHVLLAFSPETAGQMAATLLMEPVDDAVNLSDMARSALGEVGNITTSAFLNAIAESCQLGVYPTPPSVVQDMVGALLDGVILELSMSSTYALLLHTLFEIDGDRLEGALVLLPTTESSNEMERLLDE